MKRIKRNDWIFISVMMLTLITGIYLHIIYHHIHIGNKFIHYSHIFISIYATILLIKHIKKHYKWLLTYNKIKINVRKVITTIVMLSALVIVISGIFLATTHLWKHVMSDIHFVASLIFALSSIIHISE